MPTIVPIDEAGDYYEYSLTSKLSPVDITNRLGFRPNIPDDPSKVTYSWGFTVDGHRCGIFDYKGSRWSVFDPHRVLHKVFPEIQE